MATSKLNLNFWWIDKYGRISKIVNFSLITIDLKQIKSVSKTRQFLNQSLHCSTELMIFWFCLFDFYFKLWWSEKWFLKMIWKWFIILSPQKVSHRKRLVFTPEIKYYTFFGWKMSSFLQRLQLLGNFFLPGMKTDLIL